MTEAGPTQGATSAERRAVFRFQLLEDMSTHAKDEKYQGIPGYMKEVSVQAATEALLMPRNELFEKIQLMKEAESVVKGIGFLQDIWGEEPENIIPREAAKKFMRRKHFSESQRSRFLTSLDRQLIASIAVSIKLSEQVVGEPDRVLNCDASEVKAAHDLTRDLVGAFIKSLPISEQVDKNARTTIPEARRLYTARLIPEYNDWESHKPPKKRKKHGKHQ